MKLLNVDRNSDSFTVMELANLVTFAILFVLIQAEYQKIEHSQRLLHYSNIKFECNHRYVVCYYSLLNNQTAINLNMTVVDTIGGELRGNLVVKRKIGKKFQTVMQLRNKSICELIAFGYSDYLLGPIVGKFFTEIKIIDCPINKGFYQLQKYQLPCDTIPWVILNGYYRFFVDAFMLAKDDVKVFTAVVHTTIDHQACRF